MKAVSEDCKACGKFENEFGSLILEVGKVDEG